MAKRDHTGSLMQLYQCECSDNSELYRRAGLTLTASVIVGTLSVSLLRSGRVLELWPAPAPVLLLVFTALGVIALGAAVLSMATAILPQDWQYPDLEQFTAKEPGACDEHLVEVINNARSTNSKRFVRLQWSMQFLLAAVILLGMQAAMVGVMALTAAAREHAQSSTSP